jgi:AcrR family transcriptional regulator
VRKKESDTKQKLLQSALELMSEKGYISATTREIAEKAGFREVTLFRHFGSKERLFEEILKEYSFLPKLKELIPFLDRYSYPDALLEVGLRYFETLKLRKHIIRIMLSEISLHPDKLRRVYDTFVTEMIRTLAGYLMRLQKKGILRNFDVEAGARGFLGMIFSYFLVEEVVKDRNVSRRETKRVIDGFVDLFINGTERRDNR